MATPIDDLSLPLWDLEPLSRQLRATRVAAVVAGAAGTAPARPDPPGWRVDDEAERSPCEGMSDGGDTRAKVWIWPHRGARAATVHGRLWNRLRGGPGDA